ncbi:MAG: carbohydrate-binding protein, partial [Planctomycetota bacterium]
MSIRFCRSIAAPALLAAAGLAAQGSEDRGGSQPIEIGFLWHMHQPLYIPGLNPFQADPFFSFSVPDVHNQRLGPYTTWPANAVNAGSFLPNLGAHVSFSGSLIENLDTLASSGINGGIWTNWFDTYRREQNTFPTSNYTALGNPRLEMIGFGYHHPLMPLIDERSIRLQIRLHKIVHGQAWQADYSKGIFPPETAFSTRMIPALVAEGIDWALVDNIHFDRAAQGYPHTDATGIAAPNRADQINPDPSLNGGRWVQLENLWAPSQVSVPFGYQPHIAQHIDPETGVITQMVAVPAARYEGNEDGRGGYGAFLYDQVMDAYLADNNDPGRPMFVMLHHDGDNFGGGSEGYYNGNFNNMVNWVSNDPDYNVSTVDDYLARFPVPADALIHIEDGSWAGADSGDPEFKRWLGGDVSAGGVSPDLNSWAAITAATNAVYRLEQTDPIDLDSNLEMLHVLNKSGDPVHRAWSWLLNGQASDYWYWDGTEVWDSNPTRAANEAVAIAEPAIFASGTADLTEPTIFVPQREPYNPGAVEFGTPQPSDFEVWTLVYDTEGLSSVTLRWRTDLDGENPLNSIQNETYAGGSEVSGWNSETMAGTAVPTPAGVTGATRKAARFGAMITGQDNVLIDYYVEAVDNSGNIARSPIRHVWVGNNVIDGGERVVLDPETPVAGQSVTVMYDPTGGPLSPSGPVFMHYGFNGWSSVVSPDPQMSDADGDGIFEITIPVASDANELNLVFNNGSGVWDNNGGQDWAYAVDGGQPGDTWSIDGSLDEDAQIVAQRNGLTLWAGVKGDSLYLATNPASGGNDRFVLIADQPGAMQDAMWGKAGQVAAWSAFGANEADNGFNAWFDQSGSAQIAQGSVLEMTISLDGEFGADTDEIRVAVAGYQTADGGALVPATQIGVDLNGNSDIEAGEYLSLALCDLGVDCCPADITGEGDLNFFDVAGFIGLYNAQDPAADLDGNNQ